MVASLSVGSGEVVRPGHGEGPAGRSDESPVMPGPVGWVLTAGDSEVSATLKAESGFLHIRPSI